MLVTSEYISEYEKYISLNMNKLLNMNMLVNMKNISV